MVTNVKSVTVRQDYRMPLGQARPGTGGVPDPAFDHAAFSAEGFLAPVPMLSRGERELLVNHFDLGRISSPPPWTKARALSDRLLYDIATAPRLLGLLRPLLGEDIILWAASYLERTPGQVHPWHTDMESAAPDQRFVSVWIGLRNTGRESSLNVISRSHTFGKTVQQLQHERAIARGDANDEVVLGWARELDPAARIVRPDMSDGDALFFDGRTWHGSHNARGSGTRLALLLQYAAADAPVHMPASFEDWPFRFNTDERPPVIVVSGEGRPEVNREVPPPPTSPENAAAITAEVGPLDLPLALDARSGWTPHFLFDGLTEAHDHITCHASVLAPGKMPHPPHRHVEEELLLVLDGEGELLLGPDTEVAHASAHAVRAGMFGYYPAYQHHTLRNSGTGPLTYLMFKWRGEPVGADTVLPLRVMDVHEGAPGERAGYRASLLMQGPTNFLGRLQVHVSEVEPGAGYEPHADPYDVAIVVLSGRIETLGREVGPCGVVYYAAGELHGLRGAGDGPARYLVIEFHDGQGEAGARLKTRGTIPEFGQGTLFRKMQRRLGKYPRLREAIPRPVKKLVRSLFH